MQTTLPSTGGLGALIHSNPQVRQSVASAAQGQPGVPASLKALLALQDALQQETAAKNAAALTGAPQPTVAQKLGDEAITASARPQLLQQLGQMPQGQGLASAPSNLNAQAYAGGGIVAFDGGGGVAPAPGSIEAWKRMRYDAEGTPPKELDMLDMLDTFFRGSGPRSGHSEPRVLSAVGEPEPTQYSPEPSAQPQIAPPQNTLPRGSTPPTPNPAPVARTRPAQAPASQVSGLADLLAAHARRNLPADPEALARQRAGADAAAARPEQEAKTSELESKQQALQGLYAAQAKQRAAYLTAIQQNQAAQRQADVAREDDPGAHLLRALGLHGGLNPKALSAEEREQGYRNRDRSFTEELNRVMQSTTAGDIADLNAMSSLKQEIIAAKHAGNHTLADALTKRLAELESRAASAAKTTEALLNHQNMNETNRIRAGELRANQNARAEDRADALRERKMVAIQAAGKDAVDKFLKSIDPKTVSMLELSDPNDPKVVAFRDKQERVRQEAESRAAQLRGIELPKVATGDATMPTNRASQFRVLR